MVYLRLYTKGMVPPLKIKVMCDKLVFPLIFPYKGCLPGQKFRHQAPLEFFKFTAQTAVDRPSHIGKILPGMQGIAPVIHAEFPVHGFHITLEFIFQVSNKCLLYASPCGPVIFCLIVDLIAYDTRSVLHMIHQFSYDTFTVKQIMAVGDIHDLSCPVDTPALFCHCHHIRMLFLHPGRNGIGWRAHDHVDTCLLHGIQNPVNVIKIKHSILGLQCAPGGFRNPHQIDPCLFHHCNIFFQSVIRHIFIIICHTVE